MHELSIALSIIELELRFCTPVLSDATPNFIPRPNKRRVNKIFRKTIARRALSIVAWQ